MPSRRPSEQKCAPKTAAVNSADWASLGELKASTEEGDTEQDPVDANPLPEQLRKRKINYDLPLVAA